MGNVTSEIIDRHIKYWNREEMDVPLVSFKIAKDALWGTHFKEAKKLIGMGKKIDPEIIDVDAFLADYSKELNEIEQIGQNTFWCAEPFLGLPWLEAICGCDVHATEDAFNSLPCLTSPLEYKKIYLNYNNKWYQKYMEFTSKLNDLYKDKYPVGQPIMRGVSDVIGALLGQTEMVYAMYDYPEEVKLLADKITDIFLQVIKNQQELITPVAGGYVIGFYHIWCPDKGIWFQEDLTSLLSPNQYIEFIKDFDEKICKYSNYNLIHTHPSSYHLLGDLLNIEGLKVVEVNKDVGVTVEELIPVFKMVQSSNKNLCIKGNFNIQQLEKILNSIELKGIHLNIMSSTVSEAKKIMEYIYTR